MDIKVEIAPGELIDKITILEIKQEKILAKSQRDNINREHKILWQVYEQLLAGTENLAELTAELKKINHELWIIEDEIRVCEQNKDFGDNFIRLARSVYMTNDRRAAIKRKINHLLNSRLVEEKSYQDYQ